MSWLGKAPTWLRVVGSLIVALLLVPAYNGIVGNRADAIALFLSQELVPHLGWREFGEAVLVVLIPTIGGAAWWVRGTIERRCSSELREHVDTAEQELQALRHLIETLHLVVRLDDGLLRTLPNLLPRANREDVLRLLVREWLKDCAAIFAPNVSRAILLRPIDSDWLEPWESYGMPESSLAGRRFYIGQAYDPSRLQGVAGEVYVSGEPRVVSMQQQGGAWKADCDAYIDFEQEGRFPRYMTFVAIPVDSECEQRIGVLCLDSKTPGTFDHEPLMGLLLALGERIGVAIEVAEVLQEIDPE